MPKPLHSAISTDGRPLPYSSDAVEANVHRILATGRIIAVIAEVDDQIAVQVMGDPSQEIVTTLRQTADAYEKYLKGT